MSTKFISAITRIAAGKVRQSGPMLSHNTPWPCVSVQKLATVSPVPFTSSPLPSSSTHSSCACLCCASRFAELMRARGAARTAVATRNELGAHKRGAGAGLRYRMAPRALRSGSLLTPAICLDATGALACSAMAIYV